MPSLAQLLEPFRLDERNHIKRPLLDQLAGIGWEVIDLMDMKQAPAGTNRGSFTHVVMPLVLRERHKVINWLEDNRVEEGAKQLASEYRVTLLLEYVEPY